MTLQEIARGVLRAVIDALGWTATKILLALVWLPFSLRWDWLKRRLWPPTDDPERRAAAQAWAALKAEAEERTRERHPRDPHVLTMNRTLLRSPAETESPIRLS